MISNSVKADRHSLYAVTLVERVAAFGAEFRRVQRIGGLPAALVAAVDRRACRALRAAFRTELAGIDRAAGTRPACRGLGLGLLRAAFGAELAGGRRAAGALPCVRARLNRRALLRSLRLLLRTHLDFPDPQSSFTGRRPRRQRCRPK